MNPSWSNIYKDVGVTGCPGQSRTARAGTAGNNKGIMRKASLSDECRCMHACSGDRNKRGLRIPPWSGHLYMPPGLPKTQESQWKRGQKGCKSQTRQEKAMSWTHRAGAARNKPITSWTYQQSTMDQGRAHIRELLWTSQLFSLKRWILVDCERETVIVFSCLPTEELISASG